MRLHANWRMSWKRVGAAILVWEAVSDKSNEDQDLYRFIHTKENFTIHSVSWWQYKQWLMNVSKRNNLQAQTHFWKLKYIRWN